jgi:XTP/dITP diphosphohydrolase
MARRFTGDTLVIATHNTGKAIEIAALLGDYVRHFPTSGDLNLPEPEETGTTFGDNALLKAMAASAASGQAALADDSGLSVEALKGLPGIYSARWAGPDKNFHAAFARIDEGLRDKDNRRASFVCALALASPDGHAETVEASLPGTLADRARGANGFGYDPFFIPDGYDQTFGELGAALKAKISHRRLAFDALVERCFRPAHQPLP